MNSTHNLQTAFVAFAVVLLVPATLIVGLTTSTVLEKGFEKTGLSQNADKIQSSLLDGINSSISRLEGLRNKKLAELKVESRFDGEATDLINFEAYS